MISFLIGACIGSLAGGLAVALFALWETVDRDHQSKSADWS